MEEHEQITGGKKTAELKGRLKEAFGKVLEIRSVFTVCS